MAIQRYAGDRITGLSTDAKPTNISDGAIFFETDTKKIYLKGSGTWSEVDYDNYTDSEAVSAIKADEDWNATDWDTAYGWGDHSLEGYLTDASSDGKIYGRKDGAWTEVTGGDGTTSPYQLLQNGSFETWTGLTQLLTDGGLETWTNPTTLTNWTFYQSGTGGSGNKESSIIKGGTYSLKQIGGTVLAQTYQLIANPTSYRNKTLVFGAWVKSSSNTSCIVINDGVQEVLSAHSGSGDWEYLTVSRLINSGATAIQFIFQTGSGNTDYFDSATAYEQLSPTGWTLSGAGATVAREEGTVKLGTYSAKLTRNGADLNLNQDITTVLGGLSAAKGKTITIGAWVYATVASRACVQLYDGISGTTTYHSGVAGWEYLTATHTISNSATAIKAFMTMLNGDTTAYFDGAMVNEGFSPYAFSEPAAIQNSEGSAIYVGNRESYVCRAWVNFNGTGTPAIRASGNVSSITDNGTGDYTVNFTTAMPDANYAWCASISDGNLGSPYVAAMMTRENGTKTDSALRIQNRYTDQGASGASDVADCNVIILR